MFSFFKKRKEKEVREIIEKQEIIFEDTILNKDKIIHHPMDLEKGMKFERVNQKGEKKMYQVTNKMIDKKGFLFVSSKEVR